MTHLTPEQLSAYIDGQLPPEAFRDAEAHLQSCSVCAAEFEALGKVRFALRETPVTAPPESFYSGVWQRIESPDRVRGHFWFWGMRAAASAGVGLLVLGVVVHQARKPLNELQMSAAVDRLDRGSEPPASSVVVYSEGEKAREAMNEILRSRPAESLDDRSPETKAENAAPVPADDKPAIVAGRNEMPAVAKSFSVASNAAQDSLASTSTGGVSAGGTLQRLNVSEHKGAASPGILSPVRQRALAKKAKRDAAIAAPLWKGTRSGIGAPRTVVVRNERDWIVLWKDHIQGQATPLPLPAVDFDRYTIVGVFAGGKPTAGYSVSIMRLQFQPDGIHVSYRETAPASGPAAAAVVTQPFELRPIPKTDLPVFFEKIQ
jgi:hypothetical protein